MLSSALWFIMEPIMSHGENFSFLRKIIEKIKYARDALHPDDTLVNEVIFYILFSFLARQFTLHLRKISFCIRLIIYSILKLVFCYYAVNFVLFSRVIFML